LFAKDSQLNLNNFIEVHKIISEHLVPENQRGAIRKTEMLLLENKTGRIQYEAAPAAIVKQQFNRL
jgi:hypothetical protein